MSGTGCDLLTLTDCFRIIVIEFIVLVLLLYLVLLLTQTHCCRLSMHGGLIRQCDC